MTIKARRKAGNHKGRLATAPDLTHVRRYPDHGKGRRDRLIEYLHRIQGDLGHLPAHMLVAMAEELRRPRCPRLT